MDELKAIYRQALPAHIQALEGARSDGPDAADHTARRIAHALRGSGGTYGFPEITAAAAAVEDAHHSELPARVAQLIAVLRRALNPDTDVT